MIYRNDSRGAAESIEHMRTGFYGEEDICREDDGYVYKCPICSAFSPEMFYINDDDECVGCSECVTVSETP